MSRFLCKHSNRWSTAETAAVNLKLNSPTRHNLKNMNPKNSKKITDSLECGREHNLRFWWRWLQPFRSCLSNTYHRRERTNERHSHVDFLNLIVDWQSKLASLNHQIKILTFYITLRNFIHHTNRPSWIQRTPIHASHLRHSPETWSLLWHGGWKSKD